MLLSHRLSVDIHAIRSSLPPISFRDAPGVLEELDARGLIAQMTEQEASFSSQLTSLHSQLGLLQSQLGSLQVSCASGNG